MHAISTLRYDATIGKEVPYYRLKESYRDVHRHVHSQESIHAALVHLIVRTVYAPSELATHRIMRDNSAACEFYSGTQGWTPGVNALYNIPDKPKNVISPTFTLYSMFFLLYKRLRITRAVPVYYRFSL